RSEIEMPAEGPSKIRSAQKIRIGATTDSQTSALWGRGTLRFWRGRRVGDAVHLIRTRNECWVPSGRAAPIRHSRRTTDARGHVCAHRIPARRGWLTSESGDADRRRSQDGPRGAGFGVRRPEWRTPRHERDMRSLPLAARDTAPAGRNGTRYHGEV